jgi:macrolide transport system ATP-binding/permease protein
MNRLFQYIHYALRQLRKNPSFACTAILILGLGIGASVAIFAFVDAALIKPLPYSNPTRLVEVTESAPMIPRANLSYLDFLDWTSLNQVFRSMDVYTGSDSMMSVPTGVEPVTGTRVSDGFFRTLGITPVLGRDFYAGEDLPSAPHTVIVTYAAWQKRFGGRKNVIGQIIIGVLPRNFQFAPVGDSQFWTTLHASGFCELRRACHNLKGIGRLKDGVSVETALANMQSVAQQLARQYPDTNRDQSARVVPLSEVIIGDIRPILLVLLGGAGLLFLIACVNVSSLLLVRAESRTRETAVRGALGASRARLARQFITEGLVLTVVGSLFGLWFGYEATRVILRLISTEIVSMPYLNGLGLNLHVMAFAAGISLLAAMLFSITPIARTRLTNMRAALAEGSRGVSGTAWRRLGSNLVIVELAIAMVLLVGAGLLGKSLYRLLHVDLGFQPDHLATLRVMAPSASYGNGKEAQAVALGRQITDRIASLPGVKSAGISSLLPVTYNGNTEWIRIVGRPYHGEHNEVNERDVSSGYFTTLQAKLLRGRYFTDAEDASKPHVVIVNQALAKQYFPGEDPIGKRIGDNDLSPDSINEIVGVVADIREGGLDSDIWPAAYYPFNQLPDSEFSLIVRTSLPEQSLLPTLSAAIRQINPNLATNFEASMNQRINDSQSAYLHRSSAWLVGGFAGLALLLGVVGLYGVIAYSVSQRTREIGVRMALGAQRRSVYQLILKEAGWLIAGGLIIGVFCSLAAAALMRNLLFGTNSWDVTTLAAVAAVLAVSALLASYIPARRAAKVDPMEALRYE